VLVNIAISKFSFPEKRCPSGLTIEIFFEIDINFSLAAGHFADYLIQNRWTVLSVRRLMTAIGLLGPGLFMLLFISVDSLPLAVM